MIPLRLSLCVIICSSKCNYFRFKLDWRLISNYFLLQVFLFGNCMPFSPNSRFSNIEETGLLIYFWSCLDTLSFFNKSQFNVWSLFSFLLIWWQFNCSDQTASLRKDPNYVGMGLVPLVLVTEIVANLPALRQVIISRSGHPVQGSSLQSDPAPKRPRLV